MNTIILNDRRVNVSDRSDISRNYQADGSPAFCSNITQQDDSDEYSVYTDCFNLLSSERSDSDAERNLGNAFLSFRNIYATEAVDFDEITRNFNEMDPWKVPQFEPPNTEVQSIPATNYCDNIINNSMGNLQCEFQAQNVQMVQEARPQYCDNTNYDFIANAPGSQVPEQNYNKEILIAMDEVLETNEANRNSTDISVNGSEGQNICPDLNIDFIDQVTNVRKKVDKQLNPSNVNIHIEKIFPELKVMNEEPLINLNGEHFDIVDFVIEQPEERTRQNTDSLGLLEQSFSSNVAINNNNNKENEELLQQPFYSYPAINHNIKMEEEFPINHNIKVEEEFPINHNIKLEEFKCKQEIVPNVKNEFELSTRHNLDRNHMSARYNPNTNDSKPHIPPRPKVAGRKKIDMNAQRYILDDDDENIDVETVTKGDNPVIEAKDVDSLLAQFEATQCKESKKETQIENSSSTYKASKMNSKDKHNKKSKARSKKDKKLEDVIRKDNKSNSFSESRKISKKLSKLKNECALMKSAKVHKKISIHESEYVHIGKGKLFGKSEDLNSKEKGSSSRSPSNSHNLHNTKPEEQKKGHSRRSAETSTSVKDSKHSNVKSKPNEKHSTTNKHQTQQKSEQLKSLNPKSSTNEKGLPEVPKDLIGRIKEAPKPRQIKLLDTCPFLEPVVDKRKNNLKCRSKVKNSVLNKSTTPSVSVSNELAISSLVPSRPSTGSVAPKPSTSCLVSSAHTLSSGGSRPVTSLTQSLPFNNYSVSSNHVTSLNGSRHSTSSVLSSSTSCSLTPTHTVSSVPSRPSAGSVVPKPSTSCLVTSTHTLSSGSSRPVTSLTQASSSFKNCSISSKYTASLNGSVLSKLKTSKIQNSNSLIPPPFDNALKPAFKMDPSRMSGITSTTTCTSPDAQKEKNDKFWHVNLDHSYSSLKVNIEGKSNQSTTAKSEQTNCNVSYKSDEKFKNSATDQTMEQKEDSKKSNIFDKRKKINVVDYINKQKEKNISISNSSLPENDNSLKKTLNQEDWIKKMALGIEPITNKTDQSPEIPAYRTVPGLRRIETHDVYVSARMAEESALRKMETFEEIKPLLEKSKVKIDQNSLISCLTDTVPNKKPINTTEENEVVRLNLVIRHVKIDAVKPSVSSVAVQTRISMIEKKIPTKTLSSDNSSDDDSDDYGYQNSRYSRKGRRRRCSESSFESRGSSPCRMDNNDFRRDAELRRILFLGDIDDHIDKKYLNNIFKRYGRIKSIKVCNKRANKRLKLEERFDDEQCYAFITFYDSTSTCDAMRYYKEDYPDGENFVMSFGGRRIFCKEEYSDLDNMPANFVTYDPHYKEPSSSFESLLEEYKKKRNL